MCDLLKHTASECLRCKNGGCDGIWMIMTSKTKINPNKMFLKCSKGGCNGWQLLDEATRYSQNQASASNLIGCYSCGF